MWGLLIANTTWTNHYDRPIRNTDPIQSNFITLFCGGAQLCCVVPFTSHLLPATGKLHEVGAKEINFLSYKLLAHFAFFTINFTLWSHILSTIGDALNTWLELHPLFFIQLSQLHAIQLKYQSSLVNNPIRSEQACPR
jgi:hypothetical protein